MVTCIILLSCASPGCPLHPGACLFTWLQYSCLDTVYHCLLFPCFKCVCMCLLQVAFRSLSPFVPVPFSTLFHHKPLGFIGVWHDWFWRAKAKYKKEVSHNGSPLSLHHCCVLPLLLFRLLVLSVLCLLSSASVYTSLSFYLVADRT